MIISSTLSWRKSEQAWPREDGHVMRSAASSKEARQLLVMR